VIRFAALGVAVVAAVACLGCSKPAASSGPAGPADPITVELSDLRALPPVTIRMPRFVANRVDPEGGADYLFSGFDPERRFSAMLVVQPEDERRHARHAECFQGSVTAHEQATGIDIVTCEAPLHRSADFRIELPGGAGAAYCAATWTADLPLDATETVVAGALVAACRTIRFRAGR
jgi:hypothetical protein